MGANRSIPKNTGDFNPALAILTRSPNLTVTSRKGKFYKSDFGTDDDLREMATTKPNLSAVMRAFRDLAEKDPATTKPAASSMGKALAKKKSETAPPKTAESKPIEEITPATKSRRTPMTTPKRRRREGPKSLISSDATTEKKGLLGQ